MIDSGGDGFRQHFRALVYYSEYLKTIIQNLVHGQFHIPHWDFSIGEGSDIITTFHYYCLGDIFTVLCIFFPKEKMFVCYDFLTLLRLFCTGVAFSELCFYEDKKNYWIVLSCALIYTFCPFSFSNLNSHVFFISAAVYLPLIILGTEKVIKEDKPLVLTLSVMLSALSNIYFFYMNVLSTVIFVAVRLLFLKKDLKNRAISLLRIGIYSFLGVMMAASIFLPMFYTMISSSRMGAKTNINLFYSLEEYRYILFSLVHSEYTYYGGFSVLGLIAAPRLLLKKKDYTLKTLFVIAVLFISIPFFSKLYNAMVAPSDRWLYAVSLLMAYITAHIFEETDTTNKTLIIGTAISAIYFRYCFYMDSFHWQIYAVFSILAALAIINGRFITNRSLSGIVYLLIIIISVSFNVLYSFSPNYWGLARNGTDFEVVKNLKDGKNEILDQLNDDSFFRYAGDSLPTNESIHGDYSTPQYYWSIVDDNIVAFRKAVGLADRSNHHYKNYDDRFLLNALSGIRYYLCKDGESAPFGFTPVATYDEMMVFSNDYNLPVIYGYENFISEQEWSELSVINRNETLSDTAVLSNIDEKAEHSTPTFESVKLDYEISELNDVVLQDDKIYVNASSASMKLNCSYIGKGEYYLAVEGLMSDDSTNLDIQYKDLHKTLYFKGKDSTHYADRHDFLINLGFLEELNEPITISFSDGGVFNYSSANLYYLPLEKEISDIDKLNNIEILSLDIRDDAIKARINLKEEKLVCFAVPYSKGWDARVDGKNVEIKQCNLQYMAIELKEGEHSVDLKYETPMLVPGLLISAIGFTFFVLFCSRKKSHKS